MAAARAQERSVPTVQHGVSNNQLVESQGAPNTVIALAEELLGEAPEALKQALLAAIVRGQPTVIDAGGVGRVGTAALQVMLAFLAEAQRKSIPARLRAPSRAFIDALDCTGLSREPLIGAALSSTLQ
jgi:anti-anti-sigma regulatory factor